MLKDKRYGQLVGFAYNIEEDVSDKNNLFFTKGKNELKDIKRSFFNKGQYSKLGYCPQGTVQVDNVCIKPSAIKSDRAGCDINWVDGRYIKRIDIIDDKSRKYIPFYVYLNNLNKFKNKEITGNIETLPVCIPLLPFPSNFKTIKKLVDYEDISTRWMMDADALDMIRDRQLHDKPGYAFCWNEYPGYKYCACFDKREDAKFFKDAYNYYDWSNEFRKDTEKFLKEEKRERNFEGEINDEAIDKRMNIERQWFWDDFSNQYPSYLGVHSSEDKEIVELPTGKVFPVSKGSDNINVWVYYGDEL